MLGSTREKRRKARRKVGHSTHAIAQFGGRKEAAAALMGLRAQGLRARLERADEEGSAVEESTPSKQDVRVFVGNLHPKATEVCRLPTLSLHPRSPPLMQLVFSHTHSTYPPILHCSYPSSPTHSSLPHPPLYHPILH